MKDAGSDWEERIAALWGEIDAYDGDAFVERVDALAGELPAGSAIGLFERGCAFDSTGHPDRAVPLYVAALDAGLTGERRRRAVIQMASSLRNLGNADEAVRLLEEEAQATSDDLDGAVATFLALALADLGREREGLAVAVAALAKYLPRYNRSAARYAEAVRVSAGEAIPGTGDRR
jgi:tetratricopeptide (TPR) repeat protein